MTTSERHDLGLIDVMLEGGPRELSGRVRVPGGEVKVKVPFRGGYEHFERTGDGEGSAAEPAIFRWTTRTRVAE